MQEHSPIVRPETRRAHTTIFVRTMRQFVLLATFSVLLFLGAAAIAARPLPPYLVPIFSILGGLIFLLGTALAYFLARSLTQPIIGLSRQVSRLGADQWSFRRSVHTGDEVEVLDRAVKDMAARLERGYRYLESEVNKRTRELKEQYAKDRAVFTSIHHGIVVTDAHGRIVDINVAALEMLGRKESHVLGHMTNEVMPLSHHQEPVSGKQHPVLRCLARRTVVRPLPNEQLSIVQPNQNHVPIMMVVSPFFMGRHFLGVVSVFHDVTEERQLDYMKSEFISLASHQLRTPLSAITWYLELLTTDDHEKLSTTQKSYISEMISASDRMSRLIDALLHASKLEGGGIKPTYRSVNAVSLVREASESAQTLAKDRKVSLE
ncbi:MAG: histidine kinase dimerization/phospho-acceptor domain-containing protein, partial [Candidatus Peribacteraceae bacterium]|nr:histidine kinase dimerization/phospho-acceptor domain-containing protein [Candidatus Peribacteraceae bacterium]